MKMEKTTTYRDTRITLKIAPKAYDVWHGIRLEKDMSNKELINYFRELHDKTKGETK
jgi:hypothetical protein